MKKFNLVTLFLMLLPMSLFATIQGNGTEGNPYLISSTADWNELCTNVKAGEPYTGKYFRQTADITISERTATFCEYGPEDPYSGVMPYFEGTYDGDGHIMNLDIHETAGENKWIATSAPFGLVRNATFKNMHITGETSTNNMRPASLVGFSVGNNTIINCWSEVAISSYHNNDVDAGAFVARLGDYAHFDIIGCLFTGSITYSNANGYEGGGFVGWTRTGSTVTLRDCVFAPSAFNVTKKSSFYMFVGGGASHGTIYNCYYNDVAAAANLTRVSSETRLYSVTGGTGVTVGPAGTPTSSYDVSTIAFYGSSGGMSGGGIVFGKSSDIVSFNLSGAEHYVASAGTLTGTANPYSMSMASGSSVINAAVAKVTNAGDVTTYYATFAAAVSNWVNNSTLTLLANVETGSTITINNTRTLDLNGYGIKRTGSGRLFYINGSCSLTINDSNPNAEHKYSLSDAYNGAGLATLDEANGTITVNGGYITGGNTDEQGGAIYVDGQLTINGGNIIGNHSNAHGGAIKAQNSDASVTMNGGRICYNTVSWQGALTIGDATLRLYGGEISHNRSTANQRWHNGGVDICGGTFYMHGAPAIFGNYGGNDGNTNQPNDLLLERMITFDGEMTNTTPIGIMMNIGSFDGRTRGQFSFANATYVTGETASHFTPQNYAGDEIICINDALWVWNPSRSTENFACLSENTDNTTLLTSISGSTYDILIERTIMAGIYSTLCLPFSMTASQIASSPLADATLKDYNGADVSGEATCRNLNIHLTDLEQIQAGQPFLIKTDVDIVNPFFTGVTVSYVGAMGILVMRDHVDFQGILAPYDLAAYSHSSPDYLGIGKDGRLYWADGSMSTGPMRAFRAFFHVKDAGASYSPVHRGMPAQFVEDAPKAPTDIDQVTNDQSPMTNARKIVHDGVLYIIRGDKVYTARGQEVK